jgi:hypothetical protein
MKACSNSIAGVFWLPAGWLLSPRLRGLTG